MLTSHPTASPDEYVLKLMYLFNVVKFECKLKSPDAAAEPAVYC